MSEMLMFYILFFLILILFFALIRQKKHIDETINELTNKQERTNTDNQNRIKELNKQLEDVIETTASSMTLLKDELTDYKLDFHASIDNITSMNASMQNQMSESLDRLNKEIQMLSERMQNIAGENAELRKKLAFFTEIGEDSKHLNEDVDDEVESKFILKAAEEVDEIENSTRQKIADLLSKEEAFSKSMEIITELIKAEVSSDKEVVLDDEQKAVFLIMSATNKNLFITGKAGTGKSFLLKLFVHNNKEKKLILLAPTGISAINIGGVTIHSAFGYQNLVNLSFDDIRQGKIMLNNDKRRVLKEVDTIIIDEISMVRADTFEKIDLLLRVLMNKNEAFGGKQIILFGDLFQLPPIASKDESRYLNELFGGVFFFNSKSYRNSDFKFVELTVNHRQKEDAPFFNLLNRIREGNVDNKDLMLLNSRMKYDETELRRVIRLFPKLSAAELVNKAELAAIDAKEYIYEAEIKYTDLNMTRSLSNNSFPISKTLRLKLGALIMMVSNDTDRRWANGTLGVVSALGDDYIRVKINDVEYDVKRCSFEEQEAKYENGGIVYKTVVEAVQYPIVLAYAMTIHKSQGMTYKRVACDIRECFAPGQAYVALSRCSSLNGLYLLGEASTDILSVDRSVRDFYCSQLEEKVRA